MAQQQPARGGVQVDGEALAVREGPGELGVDVQRQHAVAVPGGHDLLVREALDLEGPVAEAMAGIERVRFDP